MKDRPEGATLFGIATRIRLATQRLGEAPAPMIHLTLLDRTPADVAKAAIRDVQPLGAGCIVHLTDGPPLRVMQSMGWVMALWKGVRKK